MRVESGEWRVESRERSVALRSVSNSQLSILNSQLSRPGLTLIELLIVIIILTTLVSAAIPLMTPTTAERRLREASRGLNAFISGAQMRAIEIQRPFGVGFKRLGQDTVAETGRTEDNGICLEVFYAEQPSPFVGFDETSAVMVSVLPGTTGGTQVAVRFVRRGNDRQPTMDGLPLGWDEDLLPPYTIRPGDVVEVQGTQYLLIDESELDDQGFYTPVSGMPDGTLATRVINDTGQLLNVKFDDAGNELGSVTPADEPFWTYPSRYKVLRQPMPLGEPYQMPEGTAIDLRASGERIDIDDSKPVLQRRVEGAFSGFFYNPDNILASEQVNNADPVIVMFSPEGSIERVKFNRKNMFVTSERNEPFDEPVVSNIYILVGRPENVPPTPNEDPTLNAATYTATTTDQQWNEIRQSLNWLSGESRWIVMGAQSGRVVTVENAFVDRQTLQAIADPARTELPHVRRARQIHATRRFAQEMAQLGGR